MAKYPALLIGLLLLMTPACAPQAREANWTGETRLTAVRAANGEALPLTLILMTAEKSDAARLVLLSAFGATLGDCLLAGGRSQCRAPGAAAGLAREISGALAMELKRDENFLRRVEDGPIEIRSKGWSLTVKRWTGASVRTRPSRLDNTVAMAAQGPSGVRWEGASVRTRPSRLNLIVAMAAQGPSGAAMAVAPWPER